MEKETFDQFAIVELFGRKIIAGRVTEQVVGGQGFVRVDVPTIDGQAAYTKLLGQGAIYCITPCDEKTMLAAVQGLRPKPIDLWELHIPQLSAPVDSDENDYEKEDDDEPSF